MAEEEVPTSSETAAPGNSGWHLYSLGTATENKVLGSPIIYVTPVEDFPLLTGELKEIQQDVAMTGTDSEGSAQVASGKIASSIEATWVGDSNRITPPDIRRGELVEIWQFGDADQYYWKDTGVLRHLRRGETVTFVASGTLDEGEVLGPDNQYIVDISSHTKTITFLTSKKNGEKCRWTFQLNGGDGIAALSDDVGNHFLINSTESLVEMANAAGTTMKLDKEDFKVNAPKNIELNAGDNLIIKANNNITTTSKQNATTASVSYGVKSPSGGFAISNWNYSDEGGGSGKIMFRGNLVMDGTSEFTGQTQMKQALDVGAKITCVGLDSSANISAPNWP